jgi:hypothetical protein
MNDNYSREALGTTKIRQLIYSPNFPISLDESISGKLSEKFEVTGIFKKFLMKFLA